MVHILDMDPLSITFGVLGLLPLVASAINHVRTYGTGVRGAGQKAETMIRELEVLQHNLNDFQALLDENSQGFGNVACNQSSVFVTCSTACEGKLKALIKKLDSFGSAKGKMRALKWPFEEKEHKETISDLRNLSTCLQFSLSIGSHRLLSSSSAQVLEILRDQLNRFDQLRQDLEQRREASHDSRREKQDLLDWLSALDVQLRHDKIRGNRTQNTGSWFLQDEIFSRWRGDTTESVLWCHGLPGSGKTVIS